MFNYDHLMWTSGTKNNGDTASGLGGIAASVSLTVISYADEGIILMM
jgi:hypothetical protein